MKILVFSDVHRDKNTLLGILNHHQDAEYKISLGDSELKTKFLESYDIIAIKGNYPFDAGFANEHHMVLSGYSFWFVHGHKHNVRSGIERLYEQAMDKQVNVVLYGHTHVADCKVVKNIVIANPGAVNKPRMQTEASYLLLHFEEGKINMAWHHAKTHELLNEYIHS